jgi:hypothetical protein
MSALRRPEFDESKAWRKSESPSDNRIYVVPPWAVAPKRKRSLPSRVSQWMEESRFVQGLKVQLVAVLVSVVLIGMAYVGIRGLYRYKSQQGIQLVNEAHGPNLIPFLR